MWLGQCKKAAGGGGKVGGQGRNEGKQTPFFHDASVLRSVGGMTKGQGRERTVGRTTRSAELRTLFALIQGSEILH